MKIFKLWKLTFQIMKKKLTFQIMKNPNFQLEKVKCMKTENFKFSKRNQKIWNKKKMIFFVWKTQNFQLLKNKYVKNMRAILESLWLGIEPVSQCRQHNSVTLD